MSADNPTRAAVLAKALGAAVIIGAVNVIGGRAARATGDGPRPKAGSRPADDDRHSRRDDLATYAVGYASALVLTFSAFALVTWRWVTGTTAFGLVLALGLIQALVHVRCFLHVDLRRSSRDDRQLILFSTLIVLLMVGGTLIVLFNLRMRMMT